MRYVNQPIVKKDAMALVTGKPVYTDDIAPKDCLIVKVLRSPLCPCSYRRDPNRRGYESAGDRLYPYI